MRTSEGRRRAKVAVLLSGCGVYDGTELTEGVSVLIHLSRAAAHVDIYAPDKPQMHTINHCNGEEEQNSVNKRNCMVEAARLARGNISDLDSLNVKDYDALIVPGGFGAAKNLCTFATSSSDMIVDPAVEKVISSFHSNEKVIGLCCIAPVLAAKLIPNVKVTIGTDADTAEAIEKMGATHIETSHDEAYVDETNRVVTSAAYMQEGVKPHEVDDSVKAMVSKVLQLVEDSK